MLPTSRNTDYTPASPVKSADLNDLQDQIIALWSGKHGDVVGTISAAAPGIEAATTGAAVQTPVRWTFTSSGAIHYPLPLRQGDRLKSITFARKGDGAADIGLADVIKTTAAGVDTVLETISVNNPAAAWADTTIDVDPDYTLAAGDTITLRITATAANIQIGNIRFTYDHP